jgi:hypothetical protein
MGTFHQDKGELHGVTVVVDTDGPEVYVGRCDDMDQSKVILMDADVHRDGDDGRSKEDYLRRAAALGVWSKFDRLEIPASRVASIRRLGEIDI